jgi:hypothetical protein
MTGVLVGRLQVRNELRWSSFMSKIFHLFARAMSSQGSTKRLTY